MTSREYAQPTPRAVSRTSGFTSTRELLFRVRRHSAIERAKERDRSRGPFTLITEPPPPLPSSPVSSSLDGESSSPDNTLPVRSQGRPSYDPPSSWAEAGLPSAPVESNTFLFFASHSDNVRPDSHATPVRVGTA